MYIAFKANGENFACLFCYILRHATYPSGVKCQTSSIN